MSVGLLLITHNDIGTALLHTASRMLGDCPLQTQALAITEDCSPEELRDQAQAMAEELDTGEGVLVLTDLYGSTPSNIVNLSMIVRVLNYPGLSLADLADKALSGGRDGILPCPASDQGRDP